MEYNDKINAIRRSALADIRNILEENQGRYAVCLMDEATEEGIYFESVDDDGYLVSHSAYAFSLRDGAIIAHTYATCLSDPAYSGEEEVSVEYLPVEWIVKILSDIEKSIEDFFENL